MAVMAGEIAFQSDIDLQRIDRNSSEVVAERLLASVREAQAGSRKLRRSGVGWHLGHMSIVIPEEGSEGDLQFDA